MTEEQIVKALERCGNIVDSTCKQCEYHDTYNASCVVRLMRDALDLINHKNEQIEALISGQESLQKLMAEKDAEKLAKAKSEAIKDALNRAKKRIGDSHFQNYGLAIMEIMDVEKEMAGDSE